MYYKTRVTSRGGQFLDFEIFSLDLQSGEGRLYSEIISQDQNLQSPFEKKNMIASKVFFLRKLPQFYQKIINLLQIFTIEKFEFLFEYRIF